MAFKHINTIFTSGLFNPVLYLQNLLIFLVIFNIICLTKSGLSVIMKTLANITIIVTDVNFFTWPFAIAVFQAGRGCKGAAVIREEYQYEKYPEENRSHALRKCYVDVFHGSGSYRIGGGDTPAR